MKPEYVIRFSKTIGCEKVYLRMHNKAWKSFEKVLDDFLESNDIKFVNKYLKLNKKDALGIRNVIDGNSTWVSSKHSLDKTAKTLIHEAADYHFEEQGIIKREEEPESKLKEIENVMWKNKKYRELIISNIGLLRKKNKKIYKQS